MHVSLYFTKSSQRMVELVHHELERVGGGAPWFVWMAVGALGMLAVDAHTDLLGELGHGCRGQNCNNLP
jgi:hypothetical protein